MDLLPEPPRRNKIIATVAFDMETLVSGSREKYLPQIGSHSGQEKLLADTSVVSMLVDFPI